MAATDVQPSNPSPNDEATKRFTGGPAAVSSVVCGLLALAFAFAPRGGVIATGFALAAVVASVVVLRRVRRDGAPGRDLAVIGIALAFLATAGMLAAQAAFGTVLHREAAPVAPIVAVPGLSASQITKDVLANDLSVEIHDWSLALDDSGIPQASLSVTVTNKSKSTKTFDLKFEALNAKGKRLTADSAFVPNLKAGQSANVSVLTIVNTTLAPELKKADVRITEAYAY